MDLASMKDTKIRTELGATRTANNFVLPKEIPLTDRFMTLAVRMMVQEGHLRHVIVEHMIGACAAMLATSHPDYADMLIEKMRKQSQTIRDTLRLHCLLVYQEKDDLD
jgi:hypothetical protein